MHLVLIQSFDTCIQIARKAGIGSWGGTPGLLHCLHLHQFGLNIFISESILSKQASKHKQIIGSYKNESASTYRVLLLNLHFDHVMGDLAH